MYDTAYSLWFSKVLNDSTALVYMRRDTFYDYI